MGPASLSKTAFRIRRRVVDVDARGVQALMSPCYEKEVADEIPFTIDPAS